MKFIIEKNELLRNVEKASKAITGKSTLSILKGIMIQVANGQIIMLGSDIDLSILARGTCEVIDPGSMLVDAKIFIEIIRKLPNGDITIEITEDELVSITCKKSKFSIVKMNDKEYPQFPKETNGTEITVSKEIFRQMIGEVYFAVAQDSTRPILQGILYEVKDGILKLVALDGYRIATSSNNVESDIDIRAIIEGNSLATISKLIDSNGDIKIYLHQNHVEFRLDNLIIYSRLLDGEYVNYESLLPNESKLDVTIDRLEFLNAIQRSALIAKSGDSMNPVLTLTIKNDGILDTLIINSNSVKGRAREEINIEIKGYENELEIAFNGRYLEEMLKNMTADKIIMKFIGSLNPCICTPFESNYAQYLILPVRLTK
ncbi:DNA polymerase III subunit beta [Clostridium botulinum]|uniref:Beta sliding clamp n=1 Tax=Clostridium botulinum TaxID=1491 RepID=A0A0M1LCX4_CLOBO|nr:DNA polymerase III subunit beta [Clostridium botulinum]KOR55305.1 hypothetical protein ADT22_16985 [Clostridium botulinum]MCS6112460.1 DNA polymerase III subunit beta [Clostridium botulinum]NFF88442.1 DNA polymerase III subunit beta [Clostridium botulinum]NFG11406.1 DNA polymerase III subunit beta [Clostridium botulinum]NFL43293.1 DNA polymerase III subunit beta [Clostridium botulinum]